jgi:predicted metal-dependent hydrolase
MSAAASRAIDRSEGNWYAHLQLALAEVRLRHRERAARQLAEAARLNPSEPILIDLRRQLARRERVDLDEISRVFRERYELRVR